MDIRVFLDQNITLYEEIKAQTAVIHELRERARSVGGFDYGKERVVSNPSYSAPFEQYSIRWLDMLNRANDKLNEYEERMQFTDQLIEMLTDGKERAIMRLRYTVSMGWKEIAQTIGISERQMYNLHTRAIDCLQEIVDRKDIKQ